jgi:hypothetical protein
MITFPAAADPAHSPQTQAGYLNPSLFHIIRYDSGKHVIEDGQWVLKTRTPQYHIGYGALSKQGKYSIRFNFAIYFRTSLDRHACASGWQKHTVQPNAPKNDGDSCVDDLDDEPLLSGVLILLGDYAEKVAHLRIHLSIRSVRAADSSFEFWLHPDFWDNYELHESILARLRASAV